MSSNEGPRLVSYEKRRYEFTTQPQQSPGHRPASSAGRRGVSPSTDDVMFDGRRPAHRSYSFQRTAEQPTVGGLRRSSNSVAPIGTGDGYRVRSPVVDRVNRSYGRYNGAPSYEREVAPYNTASQDDSYTAQEYRSAQQHLNDEGPMMYSYYGQGPSSSPASRYDNHPRPAPSAAAAEHRAPSAEFRAPSAEFRAPSAEHRAQTGMYSAPTAEYRAPSTQYRASSAEHRAPAGVYSAPTAEYRAPSTEYRGPTTEHRAPTAMYSAASAGGGVNSLQQQSARSHLYDEMAYNDAIRYGTTEKETEILDDGSDTQSDMYERGRYTEADDGASSSEEEEINDPEFIEVQERENIIKKYSEGPEGKNIDDWENPESELFKKMDRFGFLHKDEANLTDEQKAHKRRIELEYRREKKWRAMEEIWRSLRPGHRPKKLEERTWKGVPAKWRMIIWPRLLDVQQLKSVRPNTYQDLLLRARLVSKDIKQIDLDINRTYRDHEAFRRRYDVKQQSLLNVLAAYSMYNTEVGYCQGMSQIAALFLMYLDEEDAFWCLHSLMVHPKHTMHGFFVPGFPKLTRFETHFKKVLKKYRPRIYKHLEKQDIPYIYLTKWWFGCFLDRVPFSLALRLWDVFLIEGDSILIAMALNIMKMHEKTIRKLHIDTFMEFIQMDISKDFGFSDDETMISLRDTLTKLRSDRMHIPPPPKEGDLAERPTKALGPVLSKPLGSIREEINEIQSRHSLAVSNGRSPYPGRKKSRQKSGGSRHASTAKLPSSTGEMADSQPHSNGSFRASERPPTTKNEREIPFEIPSRRFSPSPTRPAPSTGHAPLTPPPDPRQAYNRTGNGVSPVNDVVSSSSVRDEKTGRNVTILRAEDEENGWERMQKRPSTRVVQSANHVTYISVGDDGSVV